MLISCIVDKNKNNCLYAYTKILEDIEFGNYGENIYVRIYEEKIIKEKFPIINIRAP